MSKKCPKCGLEMLLLKNHNGQILVQEVALSATIESTTTASGVSNDPEYKNKIYVCPDENCGAVLYE